MAEPSQYVFSFEEIAKLMMQSSNIHEGEWVVGAEFNVTVGAVGVSGTEAYPGAMITFNKLVLSALVTGQPPPPNLVFDAAVLNPRSKAKA